MQFRDLQQQYQVLKKDIDAAMTGVAASARYIGGPEVTSLEEALAAYVGVKHCISCGNGTDALSLAMMAWGFGPGDAVFVPDFTFFSSGEIVAHCGATPIFVDVDARTYNLSAFSLEEAIRAVLAAGKLTPKAIVAVDLFGLPADFPEISRLAERYGLVILEDGAQGFGGEIDGQRACSFGDIGATSFFPAKPLGCYGDGGAVFTDNDDLADLIRSLKVHGKGTMKYDNVRIGLNSRLDTIQAAILAVKLKAFQQYERDDVNRAAERYTELLKDIVLTPSIPEHFLSSWAQYTIQLESREIRDGLQSALKAQGIPSMVYYPKPMHEQLAFDPEQSHPVACPVTERLSGTVLSLPMHPYLTETEIDTVAKAIRAYLGK